MKKEFLNGKRIFKQDSEWLRYFLLPEDKFQKYVYFFDAVLIKKGDLFNPQKWIHYKEDKLIPLESFDFDSYEYVFYPEKFLAIDLEISK